MTIHLQGSEYDRTFLVELTHRLIGKRIDGILETIILGVHQDTDVVIVSPAGKAP